MNYQISLFIILLLWGGMILGISCLEAWVKFRTPSLDRIVALDVGYTVFRAFHRVQWGIWLLLLVIYYRLFYQLWWLALLLGLILFLQTIYLMPCLHRQIGLLRTAQVSSGKPYVHRIYMLCEAVKLLLLLSTACYFLFKL